MGLFDRFKRPEPKRDVDVSLPLIFRQIDGIEVASCSGETALARLEELRLKGRSAGFAVILLGDDRDFDSLTENRRLSGRTVEDHLHGADGVDTAKWMQQRVESDPECFQAEEGDWLWEASDAGGVSAHLDVLSRKPKKTVYLAKIPTAKNWEIPAYIGMGGWNDCPDPSVLTAFSKYWNERHGAEIVSVTRDVIEFTFSRPPSTRESAMELAREQYILCADIVDQGVGSVTALAAKLLDSEYWYFWWD